MRGAASMAAAQTLAPIASAQLGAPKPPLSVIDWLHPATRAPFVIPRDFLGIHSDHGLGGATPPPAYPYDAVRSHDAFDERQHPVTQWASIEKTPGIYDWSGVDRWISAHPGRTRVWVLFGCPSFYQAYPGERFPYPYLPGGGSPPRDPEVAANFVAALLRRYPRQIQFVELWNEPNFGWQGSDARRDRWRMTKPGFFTGTASELAAMCRALKRVLPQETKLLASGWEGQDTNATQVNSMLRFSSAADGAGGKGRDHVDALSVHAYTYRNDPNTLVQVLRNYIERFQQAGYPAGMDRYVTEIGAEAPGAWTASSPSIADKARTIQRWCMISAALGYKGVYLYKHSVMRTLGDPSVTPEIGAAIGAMRNGLSGKALSAAAVLTDQTIWMSFADGTALRA